VCVVDIPTGRLTLVEADFDVSRFIPPAQVRSYRSDNTWCGDIGRGWNHSFGLSLERDGAAGDSELVFRDADGRRIPFPFPASGAPSNNAVENFTMSLVPRKDLPGHNWDALHGDAALVVSTPSRGAFIFDARDVGGRFVWRGVVPNPGQRLIVWPDRYGRPQFITDGVGNQLHLTRNPDGMLVEVTYTSAAKTTTVTLVSYEYDGGRNLAAVRDRAGTRTYEYDDSGRMTLHRDRCGARCETRYDDNGRVARTESLGGVRRREYEYDSANRRNVVYDSLGNATTYEYGTHQLVVRVIDSAGGVSTFDYDADNRLVRTTDQEGNETTFCYDSRGRQVGKVRPDGTSMGVEVDSAGRMMRLTSPAGAVTEYERNAAGQVIRLSSSRRGTAEARYTGDGDVASIKTPFGKELFFDRSPDGRTETTSDAQGIVHEVRFDEMGRLVAERDGGGGWTAYAYDDRGFCEAIRNPDGTLRRIDYDAEGRVVRIVDEIGAVFKWQYDGGGRCITATRPDGSSIHATYDTEDRLLSIEEPGRVSHRYTYDPRGKVVRQEFCDGRVEHYAFDARGALVRFRDPTGEIMAIDRDAVGRPVRIDYPDGKSKIATFNPDGAWTRVEWGGHIVERELTPAGRAVAERLDAFELRREYGDAGQLLEVTDSGGRKHAFAYDDAGRVVSATVTRGVWKDGEWAPSSTARTHRFEYDPAGRMVVWEMPGGKTESRTYDVRGRLTEQHVRAGDRTLVRRTYRYDAVGRVVSIEDSRRGVSTFAYDVTGRLTAFATAGSPPTRLAYTNLGDFAEGVTFRVPHRPATVGGILLDYDARGYPVRRHGAGVTDIEYTWSGLPLRVRLPQGDDVSFDYDPHERLIARQDASGICRYEWNDEQIWAIREAGGPALEFVHVPRSMVPLEQSEGGRHCSIHTDHAGRVLELIDDDGQIVWFNRTGPWGDLVESGPIARDEIRTPLGLPGQLSDSSTGLAYNRRRFYDPQAAHYLTPDPAGISGGLAAYRYPTDPVNFIDPAGLACLNKTDYDTLYRKETQQPGRMASDICAKGFTQWNPKGTNSLANHMKGSNPDTQWISTSYQKDTFEVGGDVVYEIENPGCGHEVDCDPEVRDTYKQWGYADPDTAPSEMEIAFKKPIPAANIRGYYLKQPDGTLGSFTKC
jgi:RHS repeat-associated protein